jgi:drug/metabolite transporter (DMT)-like permease
MKSGSTLRGAIYLLLSSFFFGIASAFIKLLTTNYSVFEIAFCRNFFGLIPAFWMSGRLGISGFKAKKPGAHVWRSVFGTTSMLLIFTAYSIISLPDATAISFAGPLFITALSVPMLSEKVGSHRWAAVVAGFLGVLIIMKPGSKVFNAGGMSALGAALFHSLAMISLRKLRTTENAEVTTLYFTIFAAITTGLLLPFGFKIPDLNGALLLILVGLLSGVGQFFLTKAYGLAEASAISPFAYTSILWATLFGAALWGDIPAWSTIAGTAIVILSGIYILHRERVRAVVHKDVPPIPEP